MDSKHEHATAEDLSSSEMARETPPRKGGIMNTLYPPGPKPGAGGRVKNHCRKFWWCDLLVLAVVVVVIVVPIIFVAIPKKAQSDLNKSTLEVTAQEVTSPTPEGIHLKLVSVARSGSKFHPTIEGFDASLSLEGKDPFITIQVPEVKSEAETDIVVDQDIKFDSLDRFIEYNEKVMGSETFDVFMKGKTKIHQSGLQPISVDYSKKVTMKGLNKLKGLTISNLTVISGANLIGTVHIPNPSVMTLDLGNVTMDLSVDGKAIGTSLLPELVLKPGNHSYPMESEIDPLGLISLIRSKYTNGVIPLGIKGNSSVSNGKHLTYFEAAIQGNELSVDLDVKPALEQLGLNVTESN